MDIIDLKPYGGGKSTTILEYDEREILFETYRKSNNKYHYCINIYDIEKDDNREIYRYEVEEPEWNSQYTHLYNDKIIIIKTHNLNKLEVDKIDRKNGSNRINYSINTKEEITSIPNFINENYILFYTEIHKENLEYERYLNHGYGHYDHAIYLCDLNEEKVYFIKDFRMITSLGVEHITELPTFIHNNEEYLILGENYCDDWEYEDIYKLVLENEIDKSKLGPEALYYIKVDDFVDDIKSGKENINLQVIGKKHFDGWIRYFYSDKESVYYREKDFSKQKEKIIKIDKDTLNIITVNEIDHSKIEGRIIYDNFSGTYMIYEEIHDEKENSIHIKIKGLYNCDYNLDFSIDKFQEECRENYSFMGLIKGKYIIASAWYEDKEDNYYDIYYIRNLEKENGIKYIGNCKIYNERLVVYETSVMD